MSSKIFLIVCATVLVTIHNVDSSQFYVPKKVGGRSLESVEAPPAPVKDETPNNNTEKYTTRSPAAAGQVTCLTSNCHSDIGKGKVVHGPVRANGCNVCHIVGNQWEPSSYEKAVTGNKRIPSGHPKLRRVDSSEISSTCLLCHDTVGGHSPKSGFTHSAIKGGSCAMCHNPHHSEFENLLNRDSSDPAFCLSCHKNMEEKIAGFRFKHGAMLIGNGCTNCHLTHFADNKNLLKTPDGTMCLVCHQNTMEPRGTRLDAKDATAAKGKFTIHSPVRNKMCPECHEPHGSNRERLLSANYPREIYGKFSKERFALCFKCHSTELATVPRVASETNFRNGAVNLHYLHIQEHRKGLGCPACHTASATYYPRLINTWIPYNVLQLPMEFKITPNGGSCVTACHKLKKYDRVKEVRNEKGR